MIPLPRVARDAAREGIGAAARWTHAQIDRAALAESALIFGKHTTLGNVYAAIKTAPQHLLVDAAAGLARTAVSTPVEVVDDLVQSHRGGVRGLETALDPTRSTLERLEGGAQAVTVVAGDVLMVPGVGAGTAEQQRR